MTISYAGQLTWVSGSALSDFFGGAGNTPTVGSTFTGGFVFDLGSPDTNPAPNSALFKGANSKFYVDFGLDAQGQQRRYEQDISLPYNQGEIGDNVSPYGDGVAYDVWTAYGQLANSQGYEYVETGMVLLSFMLDSLTGDGFPFGLNPADFTLAGGCDPNNVSAGGVYSCARDMEFRAKQNLQGDPNNIYGDVDIYGFIQEMAISRQPSQVPEPASLWLVLAGASALGWCRRRTAHPVLGAMDTPCEA
jgi:hypothetical protein